MAEPNRIQQYGPFPQATMTVKQVAAHYGVHRDTVYTWVGKGWLGKKGMDWFLLGGKEYRFRPSALKTLEDRAWEIRISGSDQPESGASAGTIAPVTPDGRLDAFHAGQKIGPRPLPLSLVSTPAG